MDKKFLNKVVDQIVRETEIDNDKETFFPPYLPSPPLSLLSPITYLTFLSPPLLFWKHCKSVYGLNDDEVKYVWDEHKQIITDKIESNG